MAMESMFSRNAGFSNLLTSAEPLQVSEVIKAFIDVDEEGAEAAAATGNCLFQFVLFSVASFYTILYNNFPYFSSVFYFL